MKVCIYSRYSTNLQDQTSITGQQRNCEELAKLNGWKVVKKYSDEAISGTDNSRPGYVQMLADSEAGKFTAIIVDETSRITRSPGELPRMLGLLEFRNQFLMDTKGFDSRDETAGMLAAIYGGMDSFELRKIRDRTHRGLRERHKAGFSAGGKTYGYSTELLDAQDVSSKKAHVVVESDADIVREIFSRYADGESPKAICNDLNRRGIPSPGSDWKRTKRRCNGWVHTALVGSAKMYTGILRREMYIGCVIWNRRKSKKVPGTSRRIFELRPESEWEIQEHPELRIIDDVLWERVQARLANTRKKVHKNNKRGRGRPSRYLLSGLLKCGECGANFIMGDSRAYGCSSHTNGGNHLCDNSIRVKREVAEDALLKNVRERLLGDDVIRYVQSSVRVAIRESRKQANLDSTLVDQLLVKRRGINEKLERIADAIESIGISDTLRDRLRQLEQDKTSIESEIADAKKAKPSLSALPDIIPDLFDAWHEIVDDISNLASNPHTHASDVEAARGHLQALLGSVVLKPRDGVLWAHPSPNAKSLVETRLSGRLHINSQILVAGA